MSNKKNSWKDNVATVVVLLIVAGFVVGFARVNNIHSFDDASDYIFALSHKADDKYNSCLDNNGKWTCTGKKKQVQQNGKRLAPPHVNYEAQLKALPTAETKNVKYNRKQWRHWIGEPCNTRQRVLIRDGENVKSDKRSCKIQSGHWVSSYDGKEFDNSRDLDIDHVIPLGYAASHGGQAWSPQKKQKFANDTNQLLAVSAESNRSKGDKGPSEYMPQKSYSCEYSRIWIHTATTYGVKVSSADKKVLTEGLATCQ